ncbi:mono/diheme cytochrome c family protein [Deinobacterium chartae]|uniref:Mono/diheme cytochrome c family protein n=1 Tax=Deinobacterium chartae TaxID=521158 RepID=A0A841HXK8_9DEIO|nr:cytochrome c [Deinobacterium chartae]MBB6098137.1 mono/diheme cytochrome c family protein [Deinobacterium chartae]
MERNDATIPMVSIVIAAIFWVLLLFLFSTEIKAHEATKEAPAQETAAAGNSWQTEGKAIFEANCQSCHGAQGEGAVGPKLAGAQLVLEQPEVVVQYIQKGKGIMPAFPQLSDAQVIDVVNYVRNSWGNKAELLDASFLAAQSADADKAALLNRSKFVPEHIALPEIFLATFVMLLLTYGIIGLYSVWAEGETLTPGIHKVRSTPLAMWGILLSMAGALFFTVLFLRQIVLGLNGMNAEEPPPIAVTSEGFYVAMVFLLLTVALGLYKKFFMDGEAVVEDASGEFPW